MLTEFVIWGEMARLEVLAVVGMNSTVLGPVTPYNLIDLPIFNSNMLFISSRAGWAVRGSNHGAGEIFRTCPDRPWLTQPHPPGVPGSLPGWFKRLGRGVDHPSPSSSEGKTRVELYNSPFGPSLPVVGCTLPFSSTSFMLHISG
jgi:hypothetical protein